MNVVLHQNSYLSSVDAQAVISSITFRVQRVELILNFVVYAIAYICNPKSNNNNIFFFIRP